MSDNSQIHFASMNRELAAKLRSLADDAEGLAALELLFP
jgi:hypothetical protein